MDECRSIGNTIFFKNGERSMEIVPSVHYTSGGIETDYLGKVKGCEGVYAIGECQANGCRNGGRLPGYPFTSSIVYGKVLGKILAR